MCRFPRQSAPAHLNRVLTAKRTGQNADWHHQDEGKECGVCQREMSNQLKIRPWDEREGPHDEIGPLNEGGADPQPFVNRKTQQETAHDDGGADDGEGIERQFERELRLEFLRRSTTGSARRINWFCHEIGCQGY